MKYESVVQTWARYHRDKTSGVKHTPLHTLQECCEEAGVTPSWFGRYAAQDPDAPKVVFHHEKSAWKSGKKYFRKHEFVQWVNKVRQQKEKAMPDIKTALENALSQTAQARATDAHQATPQQEKPVTPIQDVHASVNISKTIFEYVLNNPNIPRDKAIADLTGHGYKKETVSSLISQMVRARMVMVGERNGLTATIKEYEPVKQVKRKKRLTTKAVPAPKVVAVSVSDPVPVKEWTPNDVIDKLTLPQAMALFKSLRNILVG